MTPKRFIKDLTKVVNEFESILAKGMKPQNAFGIFKGVPDKEYYDIEPTEYGISIDADVKGTISFVDAKTEENRTEKCTGRASFVVYFDSDDKKINSITEEDIHLEI